jgi:hypothetical protein
MRRDYSISVAPGTTAATAEHAISSIWNPSSSIPIWVQQIHVVKITALGMNVLQVRRATARGTPGSTITPTIVNDQDRDLAPPSGVLIDLAAFSVQPTLEALLLAGWALPAAIGSGVMWVFPHPGIQVPPGSGLVVAQVNAVASDVGARHTFFWKE